MKRQKHGSPICPYCGSHSVLRSADGIYLSNPKQTMLYVCKNYPRCNAYVRVYPGSTRPMGTLANPELRFLRWKAHFYFDQIYRSGILSRKESYQWLAELLGIPERQAHIGQLGVCSCNVVIRESQKLLIREKKEIKKEHKIWKSV